MGDTVASLFKKFVTKLPESGATLSVRKVQLGEDRSALPWRTVLRELRTPLYDSYNRRTLDTRTAIRLTLSVFNRFYLPNVEE